MYLHEVVNPQNPKPVRREGWIYPNMKIIPVIEDGIGFCNIISIEDAIANDWVLD